MSEELRREVAVACRVLGDQGQGDFTQGHVAIRDPGGRGVWMKAANLGFEEIGTDDVLLVGWDGEVLEGDGVRHSEWPIHTEIMLARPEISATVHSHPLHSIALGASGRPLRPVAHAATAFVPPDVPRFQKTSNLIVDRDLGRDVVEGLGDRTAMLMVNHGIVTAGQVVRDAVMRAVLLEQAAQQQLMAEAMGGLVHWTPDGEALEKQRLIGAPQTFAQQYAYLVRRVERIASQH
jgi:L-fuculose-phosphate aldolase